jgi:hypothetical protein
MNVATFKLINAAGSLHKELIEGFSAVSINMEAALAQFRKSPLRMDPMMKHSTVLGPNGG